MTAYQRMSDPGPRHFRSLKMIARGWLDYFGGLVYTLFVEQTFVY